MRRSLVTALLALTVLAPGCGYDDSSVSTASTGDSDASDSGVALSGTVSLVGGGTIDLGDFSGADLVVWFWAPW